MECGWLIMMRRACAASVACLVAANLLVDAQPASFEVASIRINKSGESQAVPPIQPGGRVTLTNRTLRSLVQFAYSTVDVPIEEFQIMGGPDWVNRDRFDVLARMEGTPPPGRATADTARVLLRTLLSQRFQLKLRKEPREFAVYGLVLARADGRLGHGLRRRHEPNCDWFVPGRGMPDPNSSMPLCGYLRGGQGTLMYRGVTMVRLASGLNSAKLDRLVIDQTGLTGIYDVDLMWAVEPNSGVAAGNDVPSIFTAVQEQLGLKLEPTRAPVDVLVIESAEHPMPD